MGMTAVMLPPRSTGGSSRWVLQSRTPATAAGTVAKQRRDIRRASTAEGGCATFFPDYY